MICFHKTMAIMSVLWFFELDVIVTNCIFYSLMYQAIVYGIWLSMYSVVYIGEVEYPSIFM